MSLTTSQRRGPSPGRTPKVVTLSRPGFGVMFTVFTDQRSCLDPRKRHPAKATEAEWCQPVFVLNLPNSRSTRDRG
jgi:hypothetical protein